MAEHLDVTETFLKDALNAYLLKYGKCTVVDNYMIFFEPLGVVDMNYGIEEVFIMMYPFMKTMIQKSFILK